MNYLLFQQIQKFLQLSFNINNDSYQRYEIDSKIKITNYANQKITERLKELVAQMDVAQKNYLITKEKII